MCKNRIKNQKGFALILVIMVMSVLMILGTALLSLSLSEAKNSYREANQMKVHYIAQAGVNTVAKYIINNPTTVQVLITNGTQFTGNIGDGSFITTVTGNPSSSIKITSVGKIGTTNSETLYLQMISQTNSTSIFSNVVYSTKTLDVSGLKINGPLQSPGTITVPYKDIDGNIYTSIWPIQQNKPMNLPQFIIPNLPSKSLVNNTISVEGDYGDISLNNQVLIFNVPDNGILKVVVTSISSKSDIVINGNGKVFLFVKDYMTMQTPHTSGPINLVVFLGTPQLDGSYSPKGNFTMQGNANFSGYIYGPKATISNNSYETFEGAIVCDIFSLNDTVRYNPIDSNVNFTGVFTSNFQKSLYSNH